MTGEHDLPDPLSDEVLDQALREAQWPSLDQAAVSHLRSNWRTLSRRRRRRLRAVQLCAALAACVAIGLVVQYRAPNDGTPDAPLVINGADASSNVVKRTEDSIGESGPTIAQADSTNAHIGFEPKIATPDAREIAATSESMTQSRAPNVYEQAVFGAFEQRRGGTSAREHLQALNEAIATLLRNPGADVGELSAPLLARRELSTRQLLARARSNLTAAQQVAVIRLLAEVGDASAVPMLVEQARSEHTLAAAHDALLRLADSQTLAQLVMATSDMAVQQKLLAGLLDRGDYPSVSLFLSFVDRASTRDVAIGSLALVQHPPVDLLLEFLDHRQLGEKLAAGRVLGKLCDPRVVEHLIGLAKRNPPKCEEAMVALLQCPGEQASDFLDFARRSPYYWSAVQAAELQLQLTSSGTHRVAPYSEIN